MSSTTLALPERRHFAAPAAIVLGAVATLFFGITKSPSASRPQPLATPSIPVDKLIPVSISEEQTHESDKPATPAGGSSQPRLPDIRDVTSDQNMTTPVAPMPIKETSKVSTLTPWPGNSSNFGNGSGPQTYDLAALDSLPRVVVQVAPVYPFEARSTEMHGLVVVEFVVDEAGRVHAPRVVSSTNAIFEEPTLRAVEHWRFTPGTRHGVPVRFRMSVPVKFSLD